MSAIEKKVQALAERAIGQITKLASVSKGKPEANAAIYLIEKIGRAVQAAFARTLTPADLERLIVESEETLAEQLAANKKTIRAEIDQKFPTT